MSKDYFSLFIGFLIFSFSHMGLSATANDDLKFSPVEWAKSARATQKMRDLKIPTRVVVVKRANRLYQPVEFSYSDAQGSFLEFPAYEQNVLTFEINKSQGVSKCAGDLSKVAACLDADLILDVTRQNWVLFYSDRSKNAPKEIAKGPAGEENKFFSWVVSKLNYEGVILEQKGAYCLAIVSPTVIAGETQVLALSGSADKTILQAGVLKGAGLFLVKKLEGRFAILQLLLTQDGKTFEIKPGEKLIVEKSSSGAKQEISPAAQPADGAKVDSVNKPGQ